MNRRYFALGLALAAWGGSPVFADDEAGRGVARISVLQGDVSVRRGDSGEWVAATVNAPLVELDRVVTGTGSRAEVQFDWANFLRLASNAEVRLAELDNNRYLLQIARGTVSYRVLRDSDAEVELSTPSVSVRPVKRGLYRITVREDGTAEITVRSGEVEIFTPTGSERLRSGRTMVARGTASDPEVQVRAALPRDAWDDWNERRDRTLETSRSYRYVHRSVYGVDDLDPYGDWIYDPPYGWVWAPRVAVGWAPYRYGRWSWLDWYGWSWVSYDPWGWAPFHYGRWYWGGGRWCWWPGGIGVRSFWRPALVGWVGFGHGVGVGFGFGRVGWVPLAPYEPFYPWYGSRYYGGFRNRTYVDNSVNIVNNVNITNIYRNARVNNAVTAVNTGDFASGRGNHIRLTDNDIQRASLVRGQVPLAPGRDSLRYADREANVVGRSAGDERFYSRRTPAPAERASFEDQRRGMEEVSRRAFGRAGEERMARTGDAAGRGADAGLSRRTEAGRTEGGRTGETPSDGAGWRRTGEPNTGRGSDAGLTRRTEAGRTEGGRTGEAPSDGAGWRRTGEPNTGRGSDAGLTRRTEAGRTDGAPNESAGWRRFGEPRVDRGAGDAGRTAEPSGGWRRFGEPRGEPSMRSVEPGRQSPERAPSIGSGSRTERSGDRGNDGWHRMGEPSGGVERSRETPRVERQERPERSSGAGSWRQFSGDSPRVEQRDRGEPVRISPPIVRERERQPPTARERSFDGFDGGGSAPSPRFERAPRAESSPRYESPRFERAPRMESSPRYESPRMDRAPRMESAPRMDGGSRGASPSFGGGSMRGGGSMGGGSMGGGSMRGGSGSAGGGGSARGGRNR